MAKLTSPTGQGGSPTAPWPLSITEQAGAIAAACAHHSVPLQVFMGMYNNETTLGTNITTSSTGAVGPFQFEPTDTGFGPYVLTNTPTLGEFTNQADSAANQLKSGYDQLGHSWANALGAYFTGPHGAFSTGQGRAYADAALTFKIPGAWAVALGNPPALPGGTAGAGGTGTLLNDTSGFRVGDPTNPDEDYWTAINRLCQERYWYCFSDGETLYVSDGPDLMKQTPAMSLDRIQDSGVITHLDLTLDNTAWQYAITHHKRRRAQRRTALAKVTSPVEAILDVICRVDEVRAGDVVELSSVGPGDGQWLAGDVRRSVFELTSEITLVPPLAPLTEGQLNPAQKNPKNASPLLIAGAGQGNTVANPTTASYKQLNQPGTILWSGHGAYHQAGVTMCKWIANELNWGIENGWQPGYAVTFGLRVGPDPHTATGASEHRGTSYPGGAIDFGAPVNPAGYHTKLALISLAAANGYPGPRLQMPVFQYAPGAIGGHDDGHCSGNGH